MCGPLLFIGENRGETKVNYAHSAMIPAKITETMDTETIPAMIICGRIFCRISSFSSSFSATAFATSVGTISVPGKPNSG